MDALGILERYWGYTEFREPQQAIIDAVLSGKDTLALLPTSAGKSICFQVPAMVLPGLCIVVSPLIALMKDQVAALNKKGIKAMALTGGLSTNELSDLLDNAKFGNFKFLYLSPERLQSEWVLQRIKDLEVNLIAVDEAHCISQWGHDFRPAYRKIAALREILPEIPVIALTATATSQVVDDIKNELHLREPSIFKKSFARPNIAFGVLKSQDKLQQISRWVQKTHGSCIVYVRNRKACLEYAKALTAQGIPSTYYHGGMSSKDKARQMELWMENQSRVMVATNAFGMGIDKPDVRYVIHVQLPDSIENYYQEAGRAGRDQQKSYAVLIASESDIELTRRQFLEVLPDRAFVQKVYVKLCNYFSIAYGEGYNEVRAFNLNQFCAKYDFPVMKTYNSLLFLDRHGVLSYAQEFSAKATLQFLLSSKELLRYMSLNSQEQDVIATLVRTYPGIYEIPMEIDLDRLASKSGRSVDEVIRFIEKWEKHQMIEYRSQSQDSTVCFLEVREDERTINRVAKYLKQENQQKQKQLDSVLRYVREDTRCKSRMLLEYFGESASDCGQCSYCVQKQRKNGSSQQIKEHIVRSLQTKPKDSATLSDELGQPDQVIIFAIREMLDEGILSITGKNTYILNNS